MRSVAAFFAVALFLAGVSQLHAASLIQEGGPCGVSDSGGVCLSFADEGPPPSIRSTTFTAPSAGNALVTFDGTMQCVNFTASTSQTDNGVIDLGAQIVENNPPANSSGPGGQRFAMRIYKATGTVEPSYAVNLTATRMFRVAKGTHTYRYKMATKRMDPGTNCNIFHAALNVLFIP